MRTAAVVLAALLAACSQEEPAQKAPAFEPTWESLSKHEVPAWYDEAKLGIFVHWGLYSVPGWATPKRALDIENFTQEDWNTWFRENPYAEWYMNTLRIEGSPTQEHHAATYGEDFDYLDFAEKFEAAVADWDASEWADLFSRAGAKYVVLTTKHHDGFTLWPSEVEHPHRSAELQGTERDLVGDLTEAVRDKGMRMGLYYSGGLDWGFTEQPIAGIADLATTAPQSEEYGQFVDAHWRELIDRYEPAILWNDITYPKSGELKQIFAEYFNAHPDGLVNNRWGRDVPFHDFDTPEYAKKEEIDEEKWETCRGLGFSFGYNQLEDEEQVISADELIDMFVDIVSKNGNLLLNVGPMADGTIPAIQQQRLEALGAWLDTNGEAIYATKPWKTAQAEASDGTPVRFTQKEGVLYAILLETPVSSQITVPGVTLPSAGSVRHLGGAPVEAELTQGGVTLRFSESLGDEHAHVIALGGAAGE